MLTVTNHGYGHIHHVHEASMAIDACAPSYVRGPSGTRALGLALSWQRNPAKDALMRAIVLVIGLLTAGCVAAPPPIFAPAASAQMAPRQCREFNTTIIVDGREQPAYGTACLQPDGSWRVVPPQTVAPRETYVERRVYVPYDPPRYYYPPPYYYRPPVVTSRIIIGGHWGHRHGGWHDRGHGRGRHR
jgi:hypothetical protein